MEESLSLTVGLPYIQRCYKQIGDGPFEQRSYGPHAVMAKETLFLPGNFVAFVLLGLGGALTTRNCTAMSWTRWRAVGNSLDEQHC